MGDTTIEESRNLGYVRRSANVLGITCEAYLAEVRAARKWCIRHQAWHQRAAFGSDRSKRDGLNKSCRESFLVTVRSSRPGPGNKGGKISQETKAKMRLAHLGARNHKWRGGITKETRRARQHALYQQWRAAVFARDNHQCQRCGQAQTRPHAHHVKPFRDHPELRLAVGNGITLCQPCHIFVHQESDRV